MIYTVTMNPAIDCAMVADGLILGIVNRADSQALRFGGKGINVSYVLKEFGCESVLTGFTAGFTGDVLVAGLTAEGFTCDFVRLAAGNTRINVKLTGTSSNGDPDTELNAPGPAPTKSELDLMKEKFARFTTGDAVVLAGSLPVGVSPDYVKAIADALPDGVSLICDLSGESLRTALSAAPDFVKPNIRELYELLGIPATPENLADRTLIETSAAKLISMGAKNALITMGENGAYFITDDGNEGFITSPEFTETSHTPRSAVGCGDSTVAGWLIGMGFAGEDARDIALTAAGIDPVANKAEAAVKLAVMLGSASYFCTFPASPDKVRSVRNA